MASEISTRMSGTGTPSSHHPTAAEPFMLVIFGASGDLTKRLLMPAIYNLACDGLLPEHFAVVGVALDDLTSEVFRARLGADIEKYSTRPQFKRDVWDKLAAQLYYVAGNFSAPATYARLKALLTDVARAHEIGGNVLFYLATPPAVFGLIANQLGEAGLSRPGSGWARLIVEKPFGQDLQSATALNRSLLTQWHEDQIFRIDHYLGKETVQNLLAFRFANGIFEPLWNNKHIDHIQFTVSETVGVEGRGGYYDRTGVLRDMIQNHMFQMIAYLCMEPPNSFRADAVRNEKAKLLEAVRIPTAAQALRDAIRGQYGPGRKIDGTAAPGYQQEPSVAASSATETFAAIKLHIDNWRWEGVPVYLRSGKNLWKRGTEIVVVFKQAPGNFARETGSEADLESNRLLFHIQPDQGIECRFHAKMPGPTLALQTVNMRFDYRESFEAARGTGYETLLFNCMLGDTMLFSRTDLVETSWKIVQPVLDAWAGNAPNDFPNYAAGSWGPKSAYDFMVRDGRRWMEVINRSVLEKVPLFQGADPVVVHNLSLLLKPAIYSAGDTIITKGQKGEEMYFICRGEAEAIDSRGSRLNLLKEGDWFGELGLLFAQERTATVRAVSACELFVLDRDSFDKVLKDRPQIAESFVQNARKRYRFSEESATGAPSAPAPRE